MDDKLVDSLLPHIIYPRTHRPFFNVNHMTEHGAWIMRQSVTVASSFLHNKNTYYHFLRQEYQH